jgi:L-alanine-DL-glutamate epimerase-like enolase superfamily enzyme
MNINRRHFAGSMGALVLSTLSSNILGNTFTGLGNEINSVSLYLVNVTKARNFSHSTWENRQHVFVKIRVGNFTGWSEALANKNDLGFDIANWGSYLKEIKGMTVLNAIEHCRIQFFTGKWQHKKSEPALMALYDLQGKIANIPTIELWKLTERNPVPGLFCILEKEIEKALAAVEEAKEQNLTSHVKVKLFGKFDTDLALVKALRSTLGDKTFLLADPNRGYKGWESIDELSSILKKLHVAGLDDTEDPAELSNLQWIELQSKVGELALVPDNPMRPAYKSIDTFSPEMGKYFNIHPDTMGTFLEVIQLGKKIKNDNRGLMIGDSSFIGPACTFWQQLAIGIGASWVEALEKPQESDIFQHCVKQISTKINTNGKVELVHLYSGFGLEMDDKKLEEMSDKFVQLY